MASYKIGYKTPPKHHQFQSGQSGNPKGRPTKQKESILEELTKSLLQKMPAKINGQSVELTTVEASILSLRNEAAKGNIKACGLLLDITAKVMKVRPEPGSSTLITAVTIVDDIPDIPLPESD